MGPATRAFAADTGDRQVQGRQDRRRDRARGMAALERLQVRGTVRVPGDKSISHRALIFAALAKGKSRISHVLDSADVRSTADCLRALGAAIPPLSKEFVVTGTPLRDLRSREIGRA